MTGVVADESACRFDRPRQPLCGGELEEADVERAGGIRGDARPQGLKLVGVRHDGKGIDPRGGEILQDQTGERAVGDLVQSRALATPLLIRARVRKPVP